MGPSAATILAATGWARSVAGIGACLTLFSRGGLRREAVDAAVDATDYALELKLGQPFREPERNTARKLGVADAEVERLAAAALAALKNGPFDPTEIRAAVGSAARCPSALAKN